MYSIIFLIILFVGSYFDIIPKILPSFIGIPLVFGMIFAISNILIIITQFIIDKVFDGKYKITYRK